MTKTISDTVIAGLAFHCHHTQLMEWVYDYEKRVRYIKTQKPVEEQETRLRLFQMIPESKLPHTKEWDAYKKAVNAYKKAVNAYKKADASYKKAVNAYDEAGGAYDEAGGAYRKIEDAQEKAEGAYKKAEATYIKAVDPYRKAEGTYEKALKAYCTSLPIEALHERLCPDCPWDGKTIFP